jgi:hypothetical protein
MAVEVLMLCKRITGRGWVRLDGAISLTGWALYSTWVVRGQKLVTQKVRPRAINGEESLSPERLFGAGRKRKVSPTDADHDNETL